MFKVIKFLDIQQTTNGIRLNREYLPELLLVIFEVYCRYRETIYQLVMSIAMSYLDKLIELKLSGDRSRILELFENDLVYIDLIHNGKPSDWFRFEVNTFDGEYLIRTNNGYEYYQQDRGMKFGVTKFDSITDAARFMFQNEL